MARIASLVCVCAAAAMFAGGLAACGTQHVDVPKKEAALHTGAVLFSQRCSGCHTLAAAATHGSSSNIRTRERTDGPNFNVRCETVARVLYAIRNGGFSGAIMPQNIVVGADAQKVAAFVSKYAGQDVTEQPAPAQTTTSPTAAP
jgi:mono/diheme cytochrome c family protein